MKQSKKALYALLLNYSGAELKDFVESLPTINTIKTSDSLYQDNSS